MRDYDEEDIAELLAALPPVPPALITAAEEIPRTRRELADVMRRIEADEQFRLAVEADIESALTSFGYELDDSGLREIRRQLNPER